MLRNRPPGSVRKRGHAEVRQFAPFELRRPFDESLGEFVNSEPKPLFPKSSVVLCCPGHATSSFICTSIGLTFQESESDVKRDRHSATR